MVEPEYAINFLTISTQVYATLIGFILIFWIFWYENVGKGLRLKLGKRIKMFTLLKVYNKFEKTVSKNFLKSRFLFTNKTIGYFFRRIKFLFLYYKLKENYL